MKINWPLLLIGLIFLLVGISMVIQSLIYFFRGLASFHWNQIQGRITRSKIIIEQPSARKAPSYRWDLEYSYEVSGKTYFAKNYRQNPNVISSINFYQKLVDANPVNALVQVFYHPSYPQKAVLKPGLDWQWFVYFISSFICVALGIFLLMQTASLKNASFQISL
ncbi:MAG: DUF3592 domain-containing protein [Verrucomicrobiae bacterium]|nr:DUF3592 domain-containing protein [Verrucomicrobiae bacterium]